MEILKAQIEAELADSAVSGDQADIAAITADSKAFNKKVAT
jgi:hypothetical protein